MSWEQAACQETAGKVRANASLRPAALQHGLSTPSPAGCPSQACLARKLHHTNRNNREESQAAQLPDSTAF